MRMQLPLLSIPLCLAGAAAALALPASAAQPRREPGYHYITVESRYGTQTVSGPVRLGPQGRLEVRMPGGTWIECGQSCRDTLRRETVDFWQERGRPRSMGGDGPGYFRFGF
jgi:hypothetical protein